MESRLVPLPFKFNQMKFTTHNTNQNLNAGGTCLQGEIDIKYSTLVKLFGEHTEADGYKVDAEWIIEGEDGTIATIYNYKSGKNYNGKSGIATTKITDWHIGGHNKKAVELVNSILTENKKINSKAKIV